MQSRELAKSIKTSESGFDRVCQLAREMNVDELKKILVKRPDSALSHERLHYIYPIRSNFTPLAQMAAEGNEDAVDMLIEEFNMGIEDALLGYAFSGKNDIVDLFLQYHICDEIIYGYAMAGNIERVNELIAKGANINMALKGYAYAGLTNKVDELIKTNEHISLAAEGYALSGRHEHVKKMLERHPDMDIKKIVASYILGGSIMAPEKILATYGGISLEDVFPVYIGIRSEEGIDYCIRNGVDKSYIAQTCALFGWKTMADSLLEDGVNINDVTMAYAANGLFPYVNEMIDRGANINLAIGMYINYEWFSNAEELLRRGGSEADLIAKILDSKYIKDDESMLYLLSNIQNAGLRKRIVKRVNERNDALDVKQLFNASTKINKMMRDNNLSYSDARFVNLHDKKSHSSQGSIPEIMSKYQLEAFEASALQIKGLRYWLLQGNKWFEELGGVSQNLVLYIAMHLTGLSYRQVDTIYKSVCKNTHDGALSIIDEKYKPGLFAKLFKPGIKSMHKDEMKKMASIESLERKYQKDGFERRGNLRGDP